MRLLPEYFYKTEDLVNAMHSKIGMDYNQYLRVVDKADAMELSTEERSVFFTETLGKYAEALIDASPKTTVEDISTEQIANQLISALEMLQQEKEGTQHGI